MMGDDKKIQEQPVNELANLRQQVKELKKSIIALNRMKKEQEASINEFKSIFENIRDGVVLLDTTGKVLKINKRIIDVSGYSENDIVGKRFIRLKMFPLKYRVQMFSKFSKEIAGITTSPLEVESYKKTGEKIDVEIQGSVFKIKGKGKVAVVILRDITERKKLEEKLKKYSTYLEQEVKDRTEKLRITNKRLLQEIEEHKGVEENLKNSEERLKILFEFAPDGYYISDLKGTFIDGNKAAEEMTGYKREELIGKNFLTIKLLHPKDIPRAAMRLAQNIKGHPTGPDEFRLIRKDGTQITTEIRTYPIKIKGNTMALGMARNITARKMQEAELEKYRLHLEDLVQNRTIELSMANEQLKNEIARRVHIEEELRKSEEKYRLIAEGTTDLIAITTFSLNPIYIYVSPSHKTVMGYESEDLIGKAAFKFIHPKDKKELFPLLIKYIEAKSKKIITGNDLQLTETLEFRARDKSGNWHYLESTANKIGEHILFISRDVTERKQAEREKQELVEKLIQSEKMEAIGILAGGVAHDLNNILGAIVGYPDLLLTDLPENHPLRNTILQIKQAGGKAAKLVDDLLTLTRRGVRITEVLNLNDIITNYLKSPEYKKQEVAYPNVKIITDLDNDLLNIEGSPIHLSKTLMNLVANALEAIPLRGLIKISTTNHYVDEPVECFKSNVKKGNYVVLRVSDDGVGIAPEYLNKIFDPFFTKKVLGQSGTGLGMSVVWWTINDHNGYINVKSKEKEGTTFELYFPVSLKKVPIKKTSLPVDIEKLKGKGEKILVVDDEKEQRELMSIILTKLGYSVDTVMSGEKAIEYTRTNQVDMLILDMIMHPGIDGLDTYREILKQCPGTKAIIVSGFSETERVKEALQLGAGEFVRKPYTLNALGAAVRNALDK
jgi:two-component system cell cycle sensor histidine kinase/response regulator CckA